MGLSNSRENGATKEQDMGSCFTTEGKENNRV